MYTYSMYMILIYEQHASELFGSAAVVVQASGGVDLGASSTPCQELTTRGDTEPKRRSVKGLEQLQVLRQGAFASVCLACVCSLLVVGVQERLPERSKT